MASPTDSSLLTEAQLSVASDLLVFDGKGDQIRFGSLYEFQKCVVVFVRHFFCGSCQQYVSQICSVKPEALEQSGAHVVIIGCGDWLLINNYKDITCHESHSAISYYADPTRAVYRALGMTTETLQRTPKHEKRKTYLQQNYASSVFGSIFRALKFPLHLGKQGNISQLGGEFIIGPKNTCSFGHYMQHTEDHVEVSDLFGKAGVTFP